MAPRYSQNDFQYGVRPTSLICYDVIILRHETPFYVPNFVLNFHGARFVILKIACISCSAFWLEIVYFRLNFDDFWLKNRQKCET